MNTADSPKSQDNLLQNVSINGQGNVLTFAPVQQVTQIATQIIQVSTEKVTQLPLKLASPYKGLMRFNATDRDYFFGRDKLIARLLNAVNNSSFSVVLGASGSGKSSVVRAGVIPELQKSLTVEQRFCNFIFTPRQHPFESLYQCLQNEEKDYRFTETQAAIARQVSSQTLQELIHTLKKPHERWLFFIDQFEELFTNGSDAEMRQCFIDGLVQVANAGDSMLRIVLAMRADFLEEFSFYPTLGALTNQNNIHLVTDMHPDELRLAVEQPAALHGVVFETGLVERIIKDVQGQKGYLPLLQYTLDLLWTMECQLMGANNRPHLADRHLNIASYNAIGGVRGALQKRVNEIYHDLAANQQQATQQIFLALVNIAESESGRKPVSRPAYRREFAKDTETVETLTTFINANLLVSSHEATDSGDVLSLNQQNATIAIAHEILLYSWDKLQQWIRDQEEAIILRNWLADETNRWHKVRQIDAEKAREELLRGTRLEQIFALREKQVFAQLRDLNPEEHEYIDVSIAERDRLAQEKEAQILALQKALTKATLQEQAAKVLNLLRVQPVEGLALAIQSMGENLTKLPEEILTPVQDAGAKAIEIAREQNLLQGHTAGVTSIASSSDGKLIASGSDDGTIRLWNQQGQSIGLPFSGHEGAVTSVAFSPDDKYIISGSQDSTLRLWDTQGNLIGEPWQGENLGQGYWRLLRRNLWFLGIGLFLVWLLVFLLGDFIQIGYKFLVGIFGLCFPWLWLSVVRPGKSAVTSVAFRPHDGYIVSGHVDGTVRLWNRQGQLIDIRAWWGYKEELSRKIRVWLYGGTVTSIAFSTDGKFIASGKHNGTIRLWNIHRKLIRRQLCRGAKIAVTSVAFCPHGQKIVSGQHDGTLQLWNYQGQPIGQPFSAHAGAVTSVAFSPDGEKIVSGGDDSTVQLWSNHGMAIAAPLQGHEAAVTSVAFMPNQQQTIISGSQDGTVRFWSSVGNPINQTLTPQGTQVNTLAISPDSQLIVSATKEGQLWLWDNGGKLIHQMSPKHEGAVTSVAFSPDGKLIASSSVDKTVRLWNIQGQLIGQSFPRPEEMGIWARILLVVRLAIHKYFFHLTQAWMIIFKFRGVTAYEYAESRFTRSLVDFTVIITGVPILLLFWGIPIILLAILCWFILKSPGAVTSIAFSPDGKYLVSGTEDKKIWLWNLQGKLQQLPYQGHQSAIASVKFSPDSKFIISGSQDKTIRLWDLRGNLIYKPFRGHQAVITSVTISPQLNIDNSDVWFVVSSAEDKTIRLWRVDGVAIGQPFIGHQYPVTSVAISPDGQYIVTGSHDKTVRLWDINGKLIGKPWLGHQNEVTSVAISPDGQYIVSGSQDGIINLWNWEGQIINQCCQPDNHILHNIEDNLETLLQIASNRLSHHPILIDPKTNAAIAARQTILDFGF
ncbi:MAG: NACHT and WD repeat domain-containing protein [Nodularia sp. CChRGM 3473]